MTTYYGVNFHQAHQEIYGSSLTATQLMSLLKSSGDKSVRLALEWWDIDPGAPTVAFNPNAAALSATAFDAYIQGRFTTAANGEASNVALYYNFFRQAYLSGVKVVACFGIVPPWALATSQDPNSVANANAVGQFLSDFIAYVARQPDGLAILKNIASIQIFNEVNGVYGAAGQTQWNGLPSIPYKAYFDILAAAINGVDNALTAVGLSPATGPKVTAPSIGSSYDPAFFAALNGYTKADAAADGVPTTNASVWTANGRLAIQEIDLHSYGATIQPWSDPATLANTWSVAAASNLTYNRRVTPDMDFMTWRALVNRGSVSNLKLYATIGNPADAYFDMSSGLGVARTMAGLYQAGNVNVTVTLSEFGGSTFLGNGSTSDVTLFANPYEYGVVKQGQLLTQSMAENLQTLAVMEMVGLIRTWDFVTQADVYELFDHVGNSTSEGFYGLAYGLNASGGINYKPAGLAYTAWLQGTRYDSVANVKTVASPLNGLAAGFDVHIASSSGVYGAVGLTHNQLVLLRGASDNCFSYAGGRGDLVVYADNVNTTLIGGAGFNELYGGSGNDVLVGGSGYNQLVGGSGDDVLQGGGSIGNEYVFAEYAATGSGNSGQDCIVNFNLAKDTLTIVGGYSAGVLTSTTSASLLQDIAGGLLITLANNGASVFLNAVTRAQFVAALNGTANPYVIHGLNSLTQANIAASAASGTAMSVASSTNRLVTGSSDRIAVAAGADLTVKGNGNVISAASNDVIAVSGAGNSIALSGGSDVVVVGGNGQDASDANVDFVSFAKGGQLYESDGARVSVVGSNVTANIGANDTLTISGSSVTVNAAGANDKVLIGGNAANFSLLDVVNFANGGALTESDSSRVDFYGSGVIATIGANDILGAFGSALRVTATGANDRIWIGGNGQYATDANTDLATFAQGGAVFVQSDSRVDVTGSNVTATLAANDTFGISGSNDTIVFAANDTVRLNPAATADKLVFSGNTGAAEVTGFSKGDIVDLLGGSGGYTSAAAAFAAVRSDGAGGALLSLGANGSIDFVGVSPGSLGATNFKIG